MAKYHEKKRKKINIPNAKRQSIKQENPIFRSYYISAAIYEIKS